jgi:xanthine/CO dehydrogenase XdhC/CoxF family maturation factor
VGIDIQSVSVDEIAVSIVAQLIRKRAEMLDAATGPENTRRARECEPGTVRR